MSGTLNGGSVRVLWDADDTAEVTITAVTGATVAFTVGGSAVTFPYTLSASTTFETDQSGRYEVSVTHHGIEIANTPDGTRLVNLANGAQEIFAPTPDAQPTTQFLADLMDGLSTTIATAPTNPAGKRTLLYPDHLDRWRRQLADARWGMKHVVVSGHSVVEGYNSHNAGSGVPDHAIFRERGYVPQLRALLADRFGTLGEGYLLTSDVRATAVGQNVQSIGPAKANRRLDAPTDHVTWSSVTGRYVRVRMWLEDTTKTIDGGRVSIDGGADITITGRPSSGADVFYASQVIDMGSLGSHTVAVKGDLAATSSLYIDVAGLEVYDVDPSTATGVAVHRWGQGGGTADSVWYDTAGTPQTRGIRASLTSPKADLLILHFISNELTNAGQTPADLAALYTTITDYQTGTNGGAVLIVAGPRRNPADITVPYTEQDFIDAVQAVAAANPNVAMLDVSRVWGDYTTANADGVMSDNVHPNRLGHSDLARIVFEAVGF